MEHMGNGKIHQLLSVIISVFAATEHDADVLSASQALDFLISLEFLIRGKTARSKNIP
jgi:hypothetical protein